MSMLLENGRWSGRIRKHLRHPLSNEENQNKLINDLLENHYKVIGIIEL